MNIIFVYDVQENVYRHHGDRLIRELSCQLLSASEANEIIAALKHLGHKVEVMDGVQSLLVRLLENSKSIDLVFNETRGIYGHDRKQYVPILCDLFGVPFTGSNAYTLTLVRNKWHATMLAAASGVGVPRSRLMKIHDDPAIDEWDVFPAIVKPNNESTSIGITNISIVTKRDSLIRQVNRIVSKYRQPALVQEYIGGSEIQVSIIGNDKPCVLGAVEIKLRDTGASRFQVITNQAWQAGRVRFKPIKDHSFLEKISRHAFKIYGLLGMRDYGRIDFRLNTYGQMIFIEAATHPDITRGTSFVICAQTHGLSFSELLQLLITHTLKRSNHQSLSHPRIASQ